VWSVVYDRAQVVREQQVAVADLQVLQAHIGRTIWPARPGAGRAPARHAEVATRFAERVVLGARVELAVAEPERA
jgi:hypothetical protein